MKRIIIIPMMLLSIYCTYHSCIYEKDLSQCSKHTMEPELNFLSCFKYMFDFGGNPSGCGVLLKNSEAQKTYIKYTSGSQKESLSRYPLSKIEKENRTIVTFDKETYDKGDTIQMKIVTLTEEEKRIINNNNTCDYKAYARFVDPGNYLGEKKVNITDKNFCFNVDKFEDLKGIMDCGYATIKGKFNNISFTFTNCYNILVKNVDGDFKKHFYNSTKDESGFFSFDIYSILRHNITDLDINNEDRSKFEKRQLQSQLFQDIQDFDMVVEDRYGNVVRYNKDGIVGGGDDEYDEPNKFVNANASGKISLNFMLLLFLILSLN